MKVLINAYACSPTWGSEPGMAWNWIKELSKSCEVFVITEGEWREDIEKALSLLPQRENLHFCYNPVSPEIRKMCWNQGDWRFYYYYRQWQKKTLKMAEDICSKNQIDIIHQLNMVGFREPGLLWKIKGPKYIWGPIGGMDNIPLAYLDTATTKQKTFLRIKNLINTLQYKYQPNVKSGINHSSVLIAAVKGVQDVLKKYHHRDSFLINETGCNIDFESPVRQTGYSDSSVLKILWVGRFIETKKLDLALSVIASIKKLNIEFHICGTGSEQQVQRYKKIAVDLGVDKLCVWHGVVKHEQIQYMMAHSDLFFFTSVMEATSTVILEAISSCLPILCFNTCGFGPIVIPEIGRKIELSTPQQSIVEFAKQINDLYVHRYILDRMSQYELEYRKSLSWEYKAKQMIEIYDSVLQK